MPSLLFGSPAVTFRGVLVLGESRVFSLAADGGTKTAWVSVGETFAGYEVVSYDEKENKLVLRLDGSDTAIFLAGAAASPAEKQTAISEAAELMRSMKFEEMIKKSIEQQKEAMTQMTRQMMGENVNEEMLAAQMAAMDAFNEAMDWDGFQEDMARIYEETFTSEEIRGLINFYSTPAGEAFVEKQPELAGRMMQVMQPRIMKAMPKMQQSVMQSMDRQAQQLPTGESGASPAVTGP